MGYAAARVRVDGKMLASARWRARQMLALPCNGTGLLSGTTRGGLHPALLPLLCFSAIQFSVRPQACINPCRLSRFCTHPMVEVTRKHHLLH